MSEQGDDGEEDGDQEEGEQEDEAVDDDHLRAIVSACQWSRLRLDADKVLSGHQSQQRVLLCQHDSAVVKVSNIISLDLNLGGIQEALQESGHSPHSGGVNVSLNKIRQIFNHYVCLYVSTYQLL